MGLFSGDKVLKSIEKGNYKKAYSLLEEEVRKDWRKEDTAEDNDEIAIYKYIIDSLEKKKVDTTEIVRVLLDSAKSSYKVVENLYDIEKKKDKFPYLECLGNLGYASSYILLANCYANKACESETGYNKEYYELMLKWIKKADKYNRENNIDSDEVIDLLMNMDADEYIWEEKDMDMNDFLEEED